MTTTTDRNGPREKWGSVSQYVPTAQAEMLCRNNNEIQHLESRSNRHFYRQHLEFNGFVAADALMTDHDLQCIDFE
jgi:hypothetical protein